MIRKDTRRRSALRTETACDPGRNQGSLIAAALKALFFSERPVDHPSSPTYPTKHNPPRPPSYCAILKPVYLSRGVDRSMIRKSSPFFRARLIPRGAVFLLGLSLAVASPAFAQKKKKKDDTPPPPPSSVITSIPDEQKIDTAIGQMLGAWQVGDTTALHKYIADDISVVNGIYAPPVIGWVNYLAAYQAQRARSQQVRLDRSNTLIRIAPGGTVAWACYQWEFTAVVDGNPTSAFGHTTLVFEKRNEVWLIVHNHTSLVQASSAASPATQAPPAATPTKP